MKLEAKILSKYSNSEAEQVEPGFPHPAASGAVALALLFLLLSPTLASNEDMGGMTARFTPKQVKPGDLFTLSVEMHRDDYGQFVLSTPSHPRLHLVTREKIPTKLVNGRYHQEERLMLQALSSGTLTLQGVKVELTEANQTRTITFPDLTIEVLPFDTTDTEEAPQPFPAPKETAGTPSILLPLLTLFCLVVGIIIWRLKCSNNKPSIDNHRNPESTTRSISPKDYESLLEANRDSLSQELQQDLESYLYAPTKSGISPDDLNQRLTRELSK